MASLMEQKITPTFESSSLKVVATETLSITASTATPESLFCSLSEMPSFMKLGLLPPITVYMNGNNIPLPLRIRGRKSRHTMVGSDRVIITFNWDNPYGF